MVTRHGHHNRLIWHSAFKDPTFSLLSFNIHYRTDEWRIEILLLYRQWEYLILYRLSSDIEYEHNPHSESSSFWYSTFESKEWEYFKLFRWIILSASTSIKEQKRKKNAIQVELLSFIKFYRCFVGKCIK